jgi:hypothetical protein
MQQTQTPHEKDEEQIKQLMELGANKLDLWRYYSDRADKSAEQLWTTGTWLFGVITAVLALPFVAKFIIADSQHLIRFESRPLTAVIYLFGLLLCAYSFTALEDIREHIKRNWQRADLTRKGKWKKADWGGRKLHGWLILIIFGALSGLAFLALMTMAFFW